MTGKIWSVPDLIFTSLHRKNRVETDDFLKSVADHYTKLIRIQAESNTFSFQLLILLSKY